MALYLNAGAWITSSHAEKGNPELQDRVEVIRSEDRIIIAMADGAGGRSGGARAAEFLVGTVRDFHLENLRNPNDCQTLLSSIDQQMSQQPDCGETTGIILIVDRENIWGASVGDSSAYFFSAKGMEHLTRLQQRKPFLGSSMARPVPFSYPSQAGTLVMGTDGLWKYTSLENIQETVQSPKASRLAEQLSLLVRLPSGVFPDDVAVATCRLQ